MLELDINACVGCKMCVKVCPHGVFEMQENKAAIANEVRCIECGACQLNCHYDAVKVTKGVGCLTVIFREDILKMKPSECSCCGCD